MAKRIRDPLLQHLPVGPDREPSGQKLLKKPLLHEPGGPGSIAAARRRGLAGWLRLLGPGVVTGASDDDPSGIGTYSQVGSQFGLALLWTALFTFPLMLAVQELCARIALETKVGLGASLRRKFDSRLVGACIAGLVIANTINVGADLGAVAAGGSLLSRHHLTPIVLVGPAAALILGLELFGTYQLIYRIFKWLTLALFAYVITLFVVHPSALGLVRATFVPHLELSPAYSMALVAVLGTTISPYLFFWQASSEVEAARELRTARLDIGIGMLFSQLVMYAIIATSAATLHAHGQTGIQTADQAAAALEPLAGPLAFALFAVGMIGTGLLAIPILSGSAAYAVKEFFGLKGSLGARPYYRPTFYLVMAAAIGVGVGMNLLHLDAVKALFYTAVINGLVAPPLLVLITLLGHDARVMRRRVSGRLSGALTGAATVLMSAAALVMLVFAATGRLSG